MRIEDARDLSAFMDEFSGESDRGLALIGAAVIDEKLGETLRSFFCDEPDVADLLLDQLTQRPLSSLAVRADAAFALGLIEPLERDEIKLIAKIRNKFAHGRHGTIFKVPEIAKLCAKLKTELPPVRVSQPPTSRMRYTVATMLTYVRLYYRPDFVLKERRVGKVWFSRDNAKWGTLPDEETRPGHVSALLMTWVKQKGAPNSTAIQLTIPAPRSP